MKKILVGTLTALSIMTSHVEDASARTNPFFETSTAPHAAIAFDKIQIGDYEEAIIEGIKRHNQEVDAIVNNPEAPTFKNTIVAFERSGSLLYDASLVLGNLEHSCGDPELMELVSKTTPMITEHMTNINLNEGLWKRVKAVYDQKDSLTDLDGEDLRLLEEMYLDFVNSGAMLEGKQRERYRQLTAEMSDLSVRFSQNLTNDMKNPSRRLWLNATEVQGMPQTAIDAAIAAGLV